MNIVKLLFQLFILYMLYKLVFDFIIPVYRASKRMKQQVSEMQQKMQEQQQRQAFQEENLNSKTSASSQEKPKGNDYIDYEEVK